MTATENKEVNWNGLTLIMVPDGGGLLCAIFDPNAPIRTLGIPIQRKWFRFESLARQWFFNFAGYMEK